MVIKWAIKTKKVRFLAKIQTNLISYGCDQELYFSFQNFTEILEVLFGNNSMYNKVGRVVTKWSSSAQVRHKVLLFLLELVGPFKITALVWPGIYVFLSNILMHDSYVIYKQFYMHQSVMGCYEVVKLWSSCGQFWHKSEFWAKIYPFKLRFWCDKGFFLCEIRIKWYEYSLQTMLCIQTKDGCKW